jgi:serine/threonine-protein kinase
MDLAGTRVGSIRVERRLGAGGMGEVWRGFDEKLERPVALKTVVGMRRAAAPGTDGELAARFLREARLLSKLGHPGICRIYDLVESAAGDFLVLELVDGVTLRERSRQGLARADVFAIVRDIARALAAAHGAHVIHRDLKPENVMVAAAGGVKILDFGIARAAGVAAADTAARAAEPAPAPAAPDEVTTRTPATPRGARGAAAGSGADYRTEHGTVLGTRRYMSPEQAAGADVTTATDVYALGVMLEELLAAATDARPNADPTRRDADPEVSALLAAMLSYDARRRPGAEQVVTQLDAILDQPRRLARRRLRRRVAGAAALGLVAIAATMAWLAWQATQARAEAERRRGQAEALVDFMLGDLRRKLEGVGRLELLDDLNARAVAYFDAVPAGELSAKELASRLKHLQQIADVAIQAGRVDAAEAPVAQSVAFAKELLARSPERIEWQQQYAEALNWLGYVHWEQGKPAAEVLGPFRDGLAIAERIARARPHDLDQARSLAAGHNNVGAAELSLGTAANAIALLEAAVRTRRAYADRSPPEQRQTDRGELAGTLGWLSSAQETDGRLAAALATRREQVGMLQALVAAEPDNAVWQSDLSVAYRYRSDLEAALGDAAARDASLREGLAVAERLAAHDPDNAGWRRSVAVFRSVLASHLIGTGRHADAREPLRSAVRELDALLATDAHNAEWRKHRALAALRLALVDAIAGGADAAERAAQAVGELTALRSAGEPGAKEDTGQAEALLVHARVLSLAGREAAARDARERAWRLVAPYLDATRDWQTLAAGARLALARGDARTADALADRLGALGAQPIDAAALCAQPGYACAAAR